jgi:nitrogen fixation protein FixH
MRDVNILFGTNAGKIWQALDSDNSLTKNQIIEKTNLTENEFFQAIGWLAKENKVKKDGEFYKLEKTNLSEKIGCNAEKIYNIFKSGKISIKNLSNITQMNEEEYNLALGWLAREGIFHSNILYDISDVKTNKIEIEKMKSEINSLNNDLETRDMIIKQITDQLVTNQFNLIEDLEGNNKIQDNIKQKNNEILLQEKEINSKKIEIEDLKTELNNLNSDIEVRNIIIKQISDQLTDKQTQYIENYKLIKTLETKLNNSKNFTKLSNEKINERINKITTIQGDLENEKLNPNGIESTLFNKPDSLLNRQENNSCDEDKMDHSTLKKNKIKLI